ncbi:hypothetical protein CBR_g61483 [Chara braunii]|uniref:Condensin complex subunit 1 C-terminal domain-containing protein n=1 Tax=Chara braunii TaxID=69332 RepID=A0A388K8S1_CHABU|nr:hypothetical protein CBR_g61483 [Chara braunii]|eukprot:GBG66440.1 hypothetical protein CBR_g61483 [Chara braunii]
MFVFTVLCLFGGGEFGGKLVGPRAAAAALSDYCRGVVANVSTSCHIGAGGHFRPFNSETSCCISLLTANLERCFCDPELVQSMSQVFGIAPSVAIMALDGCAIPPSSVNIYNISGCLDARGVRITESSPTVNVASPETVELTKLGPSPGVSDRVLLFVPGVNDVGRGRAGASIYDLAGGRMQPQLKERFSNSYVLRIDHQGEFNTSLAGGVREVPRKEGLKSGEEIQRLTVDENLTELDRMALYLLPSAHPLQQSCALDKLPAIYKEHGRIAHIALFPTFMRSLDEFALQTQAAAGEVLADILSDPSQSKEIALWLLPAVVKMLSSNRNDEVIKAWLSALYAMAPSLPVKNLKDDLFKLAMSKGEVEETGRSRAVCACILGAISPLLKQEDIERLYLDKAMALCQDTDAEVRGAMSMQLAAIAKAVGVDVTVRVVLPELYELLNDEEVEVKTTAFQGMVEMLDLLPPEIRIKGILPFFKQFATATDVRIMAAVANEFGNVVGKMAADLSDDDMQGLLEHYKNLCRKSGEDIRPACAQNLPAVLRALGARRYALVLHALHIQLAQDSSVTVRKTIAAGLQEVSKIIGKERTAGYLKDIAVQLLKDGNREVQEEMIRNVGGILGQFMVTAPQQRASVYTSLLPAVLQAESNIGNRWRLHLALLETFPQFPTYFTSEQNYEHFIPLCFRYMANGALPVKSAAGFAMAVLIRSNKKASQRYELSQKVVREFAKGRSYWSRLTYTIFCEHALSVCSSRFFKDFFFDAAVDVVQDAIASVRMRACLLLPKLKAAIKLPEDVFALERINFCATQRMNDNDPEVAQIAHSIAEEYKYSSVRCSGLEHFNGTSSNQVEFEALDKQKEEEEWNMLSKDEQEEKRKLDEMLHRLRLESQKRAIGMPSQQPGTGNNPSETEGAASSKRNFRGGALGMERGTVGTPLGKTSTAASKQGGDLGGGKPGTSRGMPSRGGGGGGASREKERETAVTGAGTGLRGGGSSQRSYNPSFPQSTAASSATLSALGSEGSGDGSAAGVSSPKGAVGKSLKQQSFTQLAIAAGGSPSQASGPGSPSVNTANPSSGRPNILIQPVQDPLLTLPALEPVEIHVTPTSSPPSDVAINTTNVAGVAAENLLPSANDSWWLSTPAVSAQSPPQSLDQMHPYDMYHAPIPNNMLYTPIEMDSRAEDTELQTDFALLDFTTDVAMTLGTEGSSAMVPGSPFSSAIAPSPVAKEEEEIDAHIKDRLQATFYERGDDLDWMFSSSSLTSSSSNSFSSSTSSSSSSSSSRDGDRADHGRGHSTAGSKRYPKDLGTTEESRHHSRDEVPSSKLF